MRTSMILWCLPLALAFGAETDPPASTPQTASPPEASADAKASAFTPRSAPDGIAALGDLILLDRPARGLPPLSSKSDDSAIARRTAWILPMAHYLRMPLDDAVASRFLDRYLDSLDNLKVHFLQTDIDAFEKYRHSLDDLTKEGDTEPAREIFNRFMQRLEQRMVFIHELLKTEKFEFTGDDRYNLNRKNAPWPKDLEEAKQLWRQQLRYEVLQEKLNFKPKQEASADLKEGDAKTAAVAPPEDSEGLPDEILKNIARRYARTLRAWRELDGPDVLQAYLSALTHVYDPHSDYLGKSTLENFAMSMNLSLFGIGAVLQSEDGYCKIRELKPGPALRSKKIKPGDRIIAVAQGNAESVDVVDMKLSKVVEMIRGPKGTEVRLTIIPVDAADPSETVSVGLVRDEIKLEDEEAKARVIDIPQDGGTVRIGVIDLMSFYAPLDIPSRNGRATPKSTTADVARLLKKLRQEKVAGVILDLRGNGGGSLEEAINLTGLFIKDGPVVQVRDASGKVVVDKDWDPTLAWDGPLLVLTDRLSASASEILAGAMQDYGRALIVGDASTFGKGTVQSLMQLDPYINTGAAEPVENPGALKITVRKFYRASGSSTQLKGVVPDIVLPSIYNFAEIGEASLENGMEWDTIPSADYRRVNRVQPFLAELKRRSDARIASDQDFAYLNEDIEQYRKLLVNRSVSLNEETRRREKKENEERLAARKAERKNRAQTGEKVYPLTLKDVEQPGLPEPKSNTDTAESKEPRRRGVIADEDADDEDSAPSVDVTLKEANRILLDLIELSGRNTSVAGRN